MEGILPCKDRDVLEGNSKKKKNPRAVTGPSLEVSKASVQSWMGFGVEGVHGKGIWNGMSCKILPSNANHSRIPQRIQWNLRSAGSCKQGIPVPRRLAQVAQD